MVILSTVLLNLNLHHHYSHFVAGAKAVLTRHTDRPDLLLFLNCRLTVCPSTLQLVVL